MNRPPLPGRARLSTQFLLYYAVAYLVLIGALGWFVDRQIRSAFVDDLVASVESTARVARLTMPDDEALLGEWVDEVFKATGLRVTVIRTDGVVIADSHSDPEIMENHIGRPEVVAALQGELGRDLRISDSTGFSQHYLALPPNNGLIIRVSESERSVSDRLAPIRWGILSMFIAVGAFGVAVVAYLARRLSRPIVEIRDTALEIAGGDFTIRPRRSPVRELDELGLSISQLAEELGERLAQSEFATQTLEVVLGALPQGTVLVGADETIVYANPRAGELIGPIPDQLNSLTPHPFQTVIRECREAMDQVEVTVDHGSPPRRLRGVASPFTGDRRILLVIVDVTDQERVASIRRDFVANASHELKTPVSSIIASSEALTLAVERGDSSAINFARNLEASARQLDRMVSDLLDLSRLEKEVPEVERLRLDLLVSEEVGRYQEQAGRAGVGLAVDAVDVSVMGNWRDLSMAVRNLLDNAVRYTPGGGSVDVTVGVDGESAVVEVADSGSGIPTRDLERVFERFYRVDAARSRRTGGTGLGLAIAKHVIESHGGTITARSQLDIGSTFSIRLPIA
jgi:two-component system phosphate regulon sensor histidine kinase PhoR